MKRLSFAVGLAMTVLVLLAQIFDPLGIRSVEDELFDQYQRWSPRPYDPQTPVRVIDIDETSLDRFGQWPWPRNHLAEMVRRLAGAQVGAVGFDILFEEADRTSPIPSIEAWGRFGDMTIDLDVANLPDHDDLFGAALATWPTVLSVAGLPEDRETEFKPKAGVSVVGDTPINALVTFQSTSGNVPQLAAGASGIGFISLSDVKSRIVREVPLVLATDGRIAPAMSMEILRVAQGADGYVLKSTGSQGNEIAAQARPISLRVGALEVPLGDRGQIVVRYAGDQPERIIPAWKILDGESIDPTLAAELAGRLIVVGTSVSGLFDLVETPLDDRLPGMIVHAEILEQVIAGTYLRHPDWALGAERLALVIFGVLATVLGALQRPALTLVGAVILIGAASGASWWAFKTQDLLLGPLFPIAAALMVYISLTGLGIFLKEQERRAVRHQFAHFIPGELINQIAENPDEQLTPSGASRDLSVMFIDVRKFSTLTENMTPETVVGFVNDFLTPLSDMILDRRGTIDKFIGDAIMAFWNAPTREEDHAGLAVEALLAMPGVLDQINQGFAARGLPEISAGAGVNTGPCSVGFMGSRRRLGYTGIGDAVNLAARLEGQTKAYGVMNCIGDATAQAVQGRYAMVEIDVVAVKGRSQPEPIHTVLGHKPMLDDPGFQSFAATLAEARAAYTSQHWDRAEEAFRALHNSAPAGLDPRVLAATYQDRILEMREIPPGPDWDGVHIARTK